MPGKYTEGYTKSAQKTKFIRHRDVKMKESELKKEAKIQKLMCEGVCRRCREKVQWKFKYDKYKPLKNPATCQQCKQKTIVKAYRTLCDSCAAKRGVCPGCCLNPAENERLDEEEKRLAAGTFKALADGAGADEVKMMEEDEVEGDVDCEGEMEGDDEEEGEMGITEEEMNQQHDKLLGGALDGELGMDHKWDERKFMNIAANKYSKTRGIGSEDV